MKQKRRNKNVFSVPDNYFEDFEKNLRKRTEYSEKKKRGRVYYLTPLITAAAGVLGWFLFFKNVDTQTNQNFVDETIYEEYIAVMYQQDYTEMIIENEDSLLEVDYLNYVPDGEVEKYIEMTGYKDYERF